MKEKLEILGYENPDNNLYTWIRYPVVSEYQHSWERYLAQPLNDHK